MSTGWVIGIESPIQGFMDVFSHGVGGHGDRRDGLRLRTSLQLLKCGKPVRLVKHAEPLGPKSSF